MHRSIAQKISVAILVALCACYPRMPDTPLPLLEGSAQLVVVTTPTWTSTVGTMQRFSRGSPGGKWQAEDAPVPVVVGRTGLAWGVGFDDAGSGGPHKQEGDGKAPAGVFPLDTVFGFAPTSSMRSAELPYVQLLPTSDCVDDIASAHYNTVVDRASVAAVDWKSAEHMREVGQYRIGVIVGYNASPPVRGRGSCIFLHIWAGPQSHTAGCTAFDEAKLRQLIAWLDRSKHPLLVQLPAEEFARLRNRWELPAA